MIAEALDETMAAIEIRMKTKVRKGYQQDNRIDGIVDWRATGSKICVPFWLALKAEALHLADRTSEALEAIREAQALAERSEERW